MNGARIERNVWMAMLAAAWIAGPWTAGPARAGIPEPPMLLYGSLQTAQGDPIDGGEVVFTFQPQSGGNPLQVMAEAGTVQEGVNLLARIPVESGDPQTITNALRTGGLVTASVTYNGAAASIAGGGGPFPVQRGLVLGPVVVTPEAGGNSAPVVQSNATLLEVAVGGEATAVITATDADNDNLSISAAPSGVGVFRNVTQVGGQLQATFAVTGTEALAGERVVQITVTDDGDPPLSRSVQITVRVSPAAAYPQPDLVYEFAETTLAANGWGEVPGGFLGAEPGAVGFIDYLQDMVPSTLDRKGLLLSVQPGQVAFVYALNDFDTQGYPVLLRMTVRSDAPGAQAALVALRGDLAGGVSVDGSIATHIPANSGAFSAGERQSTLLYQPGGANILTPAIQLAAPPQGGPVNLLVDRLELYRLEPGDAIPVSLLDFNAQTRSPAPLADAPQPDTLHGFGQNTLAGNGWADVPGGFIGAAPGIVLPVSFEPGQIPSSADGRGVSVISRANDVTFIHPAAPAQTNGNPVLLRAVVQSDSLNVQVALVALKGNLSNGAGVDGSIATHIPFDAQSFLNRERALTLIYQPDEGGPVTPALQVAGLAGGQSSVMIDRLETYVLDPAAAYPAELFGALP